MHIDDTSLPKITVVGCGVSGLTTAVCLQKAGFSVKIIAQHQPPHTTSDKAVAIWFPYAIAPPEKVVEWSRETFQQFTKLSQVPETGVSMVEMSLLAEDTSVTPEWAKSIPADHYRPLTPDELPPDYTSGFAVTVPLIETPLYLPWLLAQFRAAGGQLETHTLSDFTPLLAEDTTVINCTGLGAKTLVGDDQLYPIKGSFIVGHIDPATPWLRHYVDDHGPNSLAYIFPRPQTGDIVLGGTAIEREESEHLDPLELKRVYQRCLNIEPRLKKAPVIRMDAGLRPGRKEIRLAWDEKNADLLHNYGHGGGGFTVSWGCANEVARLVQAKQLK